MSLNNFYDFPCLLQPEVNQIMNVPEVNIPPLILPEFTLPGLNIPGIQNNELIISNIMNGRRAPNRHINNINTDLFFPNLRLTRHHIIPMNSIMSFFTLLNTIPLNNYEVGSLINSEIRDIAQLYLNNYNNPYLNQYNINDETFQADLIRSLYSFTNRQTLSGGTVQVRISSLNREAIFSTIVSWIPGNIFLGPSPDLRLDDPGEGFEINSVYIIGQERYNFIYELYENMTRLQQNPTNYELLRSIFKSFKTLINIPVTKFNSKDWISAYNKFSIKSHRFIMKRSIVYENINSNYTLFTYCYPIDLLNTINKVNKLEEEQQIQLENEMKDKRKKSLCGIAVPTSTLVALLGGCGGGAAIGSVFPGIGTAIGCVGGAFGVGMTVLGTSTAICT